MTTDNRACNAGPTPCATTEILGGLSPELARMLDELMGLLREEERPRLRPAIEASVLAQARGDAGDAERQRRFVRDLDILAHMHGPQFMYSRGIAETLRVGEDIVELGYALQKALK